MTKQTVIILSLFLQFGCNRQQPDLERIQYGRNDITRYVPKDKTVPGNLGGKRLRGFVDFAFLLRRDNAILDKHIFRIQAGFDELHMVNYGNGKENTRKADSVYQILLPWLNNFMNAIRVENAENAEYFKNQDSIWLHYAFTFNDTTVETDTSKHIILYPQFSFKLTSPQIQFPIVDLKEKIAGTCNVAVGVNSKKEIVHINLMSIELYIKNDTVRCELLKENTDEGIYYYSKINPLLHSYISQTKIKNFKKLGSEWRQYIGYEFKAIAFKASSKKGLHYLEFR